MQLYSFDMHSPSITLYGRAPAQAWGVVWTRRDRDGPEASRIPGTFFLNQGLPSFTANGARPPEHYWVPPDPPVLQSDGSGYIYRLPDR